MLPTLVCSKDKYLMIDDKSCSSLENCFSTIAIFIIIPQCLFYIVYKPTQNAALKIAIFTSVGGSEIGNIARKCMTAIGNVTGNVNHHNQT